LHNAEIKQVNHVENLSIIFLSETHFSLIIPGETPSENKILHVHIIQELKPAEFVHHSKCG